MPVIPLIVSSVATSLMIAATIINPAEIPVSPPMRIAIDAVRMKIPGIVKFPGHHHVQMPVAAIMPVPQLTVIPAAVALIAAISGP